MKLLNRSGFTLIEVIAVLVIIGVLAAVAATSSVSSPVEAVQAADTLKAHLRFAQLRAMNSDTVWGVQFNGNAYSLFQVVAGSPVIVRFPGADGNSVSLPDGVSISDEVSFDSWGRPHDNATGTSLAAADMTFGVDGQTITITAGTGYIP